MASLFARPVFMHHADPSGEYQTHRVDMMLEYSTDDSPTMQAASVHHPYKGHIELKHYAALRGLTL